MRQARKGRERRILLTLRELRRQKVPRCGIEKFFSSKRRSPDGRVYVTAKKIYRMKDRGVAVWLAKRFANHLRLCGRVTECRPGCCWKEYRGGHLVKRSLYGRPA